MREILGKRRKDRRTPRDAALGYAAAQHWALLPGVPLGPDGRCACATRDCPAPGAHPGGPLAPALPEVPELLAATAEPRMVDWWWTTRPLAPLLLATGAGSGDGHRAPCALSLPASAGRRTLAALDWLGVKTGPVLATPVRVALFVAPYDLPELGDALCELLEEPPPPLPPRLPRMRRPPGGRRPARLREGAPDPHGADTGPPPGVARLPSGLGFHGIGGYLPLPPSRTGAGAAEWVRDSALPLPGAISMLRALIAAERVAPPGGPVAWHRRRGTGLFPRGEAGG